MALKRPEAPARRKRETVKRGGGSYKVKGQRASAVQRRTIDGCLEQAAKDGASRRVMIATIMCITQESGAGALAAVMTGNDDVGIFQQGRNWISEKGSKDPAASTHAFLITGPTSWKKVHGGVKKAPGNLEQALKRVQISVGGYAPWEAEATATVKEWLANGGSSESEDGGGSYTKRYTFTRGEKGGSRENSWDAAARLVEEVGAYRWAAGNTFYAVSGDELRQASPSRRIQGDEGWLLKEPAWSWSAGRPISEVTLEVLADRFEILPGAVVVLARRFGPMQGRWLVWGVSGESLDSPAATVVLRRPTRLKSEPPSQKAQRPGSDSGDGDSAGGAGKLKNTYSGSPVPGQRPHASTHQTAGLPGYPAFDYMEPAGTPCVSPTDGEVTKISGSAPGAHCSPGGACGYSVYISGGGKSYFLTHIDKLSVKVGNKVRQGEQIAEVANGPRHWSTPHVHMGVRG